MVRVRVSQVKRQAMSIVVIILEPASPAAMPEHLIGVISDTHGLLRPEAVKALKGVERIIHAGDVGDPRCWRIWRASPGACSPGNTDRGDWAADLPHTRVVEVGGVHLYVLHELFTLDLDPAAARLAAVIFGHSTVPTWSAKTASSTSTPAARAKAVYLPVSLAFLSVQDGCVQAKFIDLKI